MESLLTLLASNLIWQTALVGGAVFIALKVLPRVHASLRYQIALGGLFGCLLLLAAPFLPSVFSEISVGIMPNVISNTQIPTSALEAASLEQMITTNAPQNIASISNAALPSISKVLIIIWGLGSILLLLRIIAAVFLSTKWVQKANPVWLPQGQSLSQNVKILRSEHANAPLVLGMLNPVILVPNGFVVDVDRPDVRVVLEHEIAHISRRDLWTNFAQRIVLALLWWCLPLYWVNTQIGIEREKLCDDIAAKRTGKGRALARALVDLAATHNHTSPPLLAIGIHPRANQLTERVHRLYTGTTMLKLSKKLFASTALMVPVTLVGLTLVTPRAFAHNPKETAQWITPHDKRQDITPMQQALYASTEKSDYATAQQLLAMGESPNFVLHGDGTPLFVAVRKQDVKMINLLINSGADVNLAAPGDGNPLIQAAMRGNVKIAKLLLGRGADINAFVMGDETPLINAAQQGYLEMVTFLVTNGADPSLGAWANHYENKASEWRTPFGEATKHGHTDVASYLAAQGASKKDGIPPQQTSYVVTQGRITSRFGHKRSKKITDLGVNKRHRGIDIANKLGTPIYAPADGRITLTANTYDVTVNYGKIDRYGKTLELVSAGNVKTKFAHLKGFAVKIGDEVKAGDLIAYMGNTGVSTGPHVHIETQVNGKLVDPQSVWPNLK